MRSKKASRHAPRRPIRFIIGCVLFLLAALPGCDRDSPGKRGLGVERLYIDPVSGALARPVDPDAVQTLARDYHRLFDQTADRLERLMTMAGEPGADCDRAGRRLQAYLAENELNDSQRFESFAERLWMRSRKEAELVIQRSREGIERRMKRFKARLSRHKKDLDGFADRCPDAAGDVQAALERFLEQTVGGR
jgi:hypothetical protein